MNGILKPTCVIFIFCLLFSTLLFAQDKRTQLPGFLANSYAGFNIGYINTPLSSRQLEPGYEAESVSNPQLGVRITLAGYRFNKNLSGQVTYWKPVNYTKYHSINGDKKTYSSWVHQGTMTLRSQVPIRKKLSVFAEAGFGIVTRRGFQVNGLDVVKNSTDANLVLGAGFEYQVNRNWNIIAGTTYSTAVERSRQPSTVFHSAGFRYNLQPLPADKVARNNEGGYFFPKHLVQVAYTTNRFGYWANDFFSHEFPIYWGGRIQIAKGAFVRYQRNIYHSKKFFSFDVGTSVGWWQGRNLKENAYTFSVYPLFRFSLLRTKPFDMYFNYCVAGPSYITRTMMEGKNSGRHFTFQDFMGIGFFIGKQRHLNAEVILNHYSNGNIFPFNAGLKIPTTFTLGYAF